VRTRWTEGPVELTLVRHGESLGNRADAAAREAKAERLDLDERDADVALSDTGIEQADGVAKWLAGDGASAPPDLVISSPSRRARETAERIVAGLDVDLVFDERLRERDLGVFDGMTGLGIRSAYPEEAKRRQKLGKFYYQPPSGESWCDVVLRVRSLLEDLRWGYDGARLWMVTHQAVIMSFRFALEELTEEELLEIDREVQIPNASMTTYRRDGDRLELISFADTSAVDETEADVTHEEPRGSGQREHA
jgi:broad specificity phosphatase PhoE